MKRETRLISIPTRRKNEFNASKSVRRSCIALGASRPRIILPGNRTISPDDFDALNSFFLLVGIGEEILDFASRQGDLDADRQ
jgi:hypothetical protein